MSFIPGVVTDINDPLRLGRVKVKLPTITGQETPYWVLPAGWPSSGGTSSYGTRYPPPPVGGNVAVFFAFGDVSASEPLALYIPMTGGVNPTTGLPAGPTTVSAGVTTDDTNKRVCVWEDTTFVISIQADVYGKKVVIGTQNGHTAITINAAEGSGGKSVTVDILGQTGVTLRSNGIIDISASRVQIQGRVVNSLSTSPI